MGMSTHIVGFTGPSEEWHKMKAVYDACEAAGLQPPFQVVEFFGHEEPDAAGVRVELDHHLGVTAYNGDAETGYEVNVQVLLKILPELKTIRFYNGY